ncbi:hypothetical protein Trydic_g18815 [Trypoxylus dichotomus]
MGSIPLITSIGDLRNLITCLFFGLALPLVMKSVIDFEDLNLDPLAIRRALKKRNPCYIKCVKKLYFCVFIAILKKLQWNLPERSVSNHSRRYWCKFLERHKIKTETVIDSHLKDVFVMTNTEQCFDWICLITGLAFALGANVPAFNNEKRIIWCCIPYTLAKNKNEQNPSTSQDNTFLVDFPKHTAFFNTSHVEVLFSIDWSNTC